MKGFVNYFFAIEQELTYDCPRFAKLAKTATEET